MAVNTWNEFPQVGVVDGKGLGYGGSLGPFGWFEVVIGGGGGCSLFRVNI